MAKFTISPVTELQGAFIVTPDRFHDERGFFQEHFNDERYQSVVKQCRQISFSHSKRNVIRGMHCSRYGKLVQCLRGKLLDVVIDLRVGSPTYLNCIRVELNESEAKQVFIPAGCGHGFFSYEDNTLMLYAQEGTFHPPTEMNVNYADPMLKIVWPDAIGGEGAKHLISAKDLAAPYFEDALKVFKERNPPASQ